jgi:hypothetical protein
MTMKKIIKRNLYVQEEIRKLMIGKNKINVYFVFTQCQLWGLQSVYEKMLTSDTFDPFVIVMPNTEDRVTDVKITHDTNMKFFSKLGVKIISGLDKHFKIEKFNDIVAQHSIVFFDQPFPQLPDDWSFDKVSRRSLICYVPYGFKVARSYNAHFNLMLQNIAWRVFAETEWHRKQFINIGKRGGDNVVVSGYPKFDAYRLPVKKIARGFNKEDLGVYKKIIIWAPHWSINDDFLGYSTFDLYYQKFQKAARDDKTIYWAFKPHQRLKYHLIETGFMEDVEIDNYYNFWSNSDNTDYYGEGDYLDLFKMSDALITDSGSFLAEYLPTGKPVLLLQSKNTVGYNEFGEQIVQSYYKAKNWEEVNYFIKDVMSNEDEMIDKRKSLIPLVLPNVSITTGEFILHNIEDAILGQCH